MSNEIFQLVNRLELLAETHLVDGDNREAADRCLERLRALYKDRPNVFDPSLVARIKTFKDKIISSCGDQFTKDGSLPRADYEFDFPHGHWW